MQRESSNIIKTLENTGSVKFKRPDHVHDTKTHEAHVKNGLIVVDDEFTMTWDTLQYLYLEGYPTEFDEN